MRSPTKFEDARSNPFRREHRGPIEACNPGIPAGRPIPAPQTAREMASDSGTDMDRGRCAILKMAAQITINDRRLVDTIVLEGMGLPTAGVESRSKSPTDPTALAVRQ
jgi:hypothetical protein